MSIHQRSINELKNEDLRLIIGRKSQELEELREFVKHNEDALEAQLLALRKELDEKDVLITNMTVEKQQTNTTSNDPTWNRSSHHQTTNNNNENNNNTDENMDNRQFNENIPPRKLDETRQRMLSAMEKSSQIPMDALRTATKECCIMDRGFI